MILNLTLRQREIHLNDVKRELRSGEELWVSKPCIRIGQSEILSPQHCVRTQPEKAYPFPEPDC